MKRIKNKHVMLFEIILLVAAFLAGFLVRGGNDGQGHEIAAQETEKEADVWTCSMHPQIKLPKAGQCPICFMDLIPLVTDDDDKGGPRELSVSENAKALMAIETAPVERRSVTAEVRMVGKIDYDETRVSTITAWVPGRLDRLFVDYTGVPVQKGDHMVSLYSPELLSAQEELLQAVRAAARTGQDQVPVGRDTPGATILSVREKLRLWGLTPEQVEQIEQRGTAEDHMTVYAPTGGIVINKNAQEGMYVQTGTRIYTIADLSWLWVNLDAYESDLQWLKYGQKVTFTAEAYPGEPFTGTISFIQPMLDEATRTVKVRVNVANENGRLKPGMFVRAVTEVEVGDTPLVIPASAPLLTGKRAIVYVEVPGSEKPTYEGREIVLGPRAGDFYLVNRGLQTGERVVTAGAFKLDAELQIRAKPSMMTPDGGGGGHAPHGATAITATGHFDQATHGQMHGGDSPSSVLAVDPEFQKQLGAVVKGYLKVQEALAADDHGAAAASAKQALEGLGKVDMGLVEGDAHMAWMTSAGELKSLLQAVSETDGIEPARARFALLSEGMATVLARFGVAEGKLFKAWCPMAFDNRGASWIQGTEEINNPYFGAMMLRCGEIQGVIE